VNDSTKKKIDELMKWSEWKEWIQFKYRRSPTAENMKEDYF
jgi:hypothetical protein